MVPGSLRRGLSTGLCILALLFLLLGLRLSSTSAAWEGFFLPLIGKGWPVFIWTPDEEVDLRRAIAKRPYGVISDQPLRAKRIRDE